MDADGKTLLHSTENTDFAELLIEHGANVHAVDADGKTPYVVEVMKVLKREKIVIVYDPGL